MGSIMYFCWKYTVFLSKLASQDIDVKFCVKETHANLSYFLFDVDNDQEDRKTQREDKVKEVLYNRPPAARPTWGHIFNCQFQLF